jgi:SAM-dependent methyltransferase
MSESFTPIRNSSGNSRIGRVAFFARMIVDLQIYSIYRDIRRPIGREVPNERSSQGSGSRAARPWLLDVGCGDSPYRFLLDDLYTYHGIDIVEADHFGYNNADVQAFDGVSIPFGQDCFHVILCTEVLEHVQNYQQLVDEMYRVLEPGGMALITVPWSARYHYIPHDFFRYTPSTLQFMFAKFSSTEIRSRGSILAVISNKLLVMIVITLRKRTLAYVLLWPLALLCVPLLVLALIGAHIGFALDINSDVDPLGYTVIARK